MTACATGRVQSGELPAARVARTVYQGPCEGLVAAWGEFDAWNTAQGYTPATDLWECYLLGPESGSNPALRRTELITSTRETVHGLLALR